MASQIRGTVRYVAVVISVLLGLLVVAQVAQLVALTGAINPWFGTAVALALAALFVWLVALPLLAYLRLSPALLPPAEAEGPTHDAFAARYLAVCRENPRLREHSLESEDDLKTALAFLTREAEAVANRTASRVFVGTAISQYGSLDSLIVAYLQARMVWQIAHVFQARPSLKHMAYLHSNVLATSVVASNLENVDLSEYVQPIMAGMLGQSTAAVPGLSSVASQFANATFQGSVNAFLTLRLAMVAISYSNALSRPQRGAVWQSAVARAGGLVARTIAAGTFELSKAFATAAGRTVLNSAKSAGQAVVDGTTRLGTGVAGAGKAIGTATTGAAEKVATTTRSSLGTVTPKKRERGETKPQETKRRGIRLRRRKAPVD